MKGLGGIGMTSTAHGRFKHSPESPLTPRLLLIARALLVVALSVTLVGCGGGGEDETSSGTASSPGDNASSEASTDESSDTESDDTQAFCDAANEIIAAEEKLSAAIQASAGDPSATQKAYKQFVAKSGEILDTLVETAPADIKSSVEAYADSYRAYASGNVSKGAALNKKSAEAIGYVRGNCLKG